MQYISISWDIKAVPYIIMRFSDRAPWRHVPVRVSLHFPDSWSSAWVWLLFLSCGQCTVLSTAFWKLWKRVIIREADHCLVHVVVKKERRCASSSLIRLHGVHRDTFNTNQIGIVTDSMHCEINEICCLALGIAARLYCLSFAFSACMKYRWENLIFFSLLVLL